MSRATVRTAMAFGLGLILASAPEAQSQREFTSSRNLQGEERLELHIDHAAGRLEVAEGDPRRLYEFALRYDENVIHPVADYQPWAGVLRLGTESLERAGFRGSGDESTASIRIAPTVPTDLEMRFGAGQAQLELGGLSLRSAELTTGASETRIAFSSRNRVPGDLVRIRSGVASVHAESLGNSRAKRFEIEGGIGKTLLDFGGSWEGDATASVKMGIGSLRLRFPRDLGIRLTRTSLLTRLNTEGLERRGNGFQSSNWASAPYKLTVHVEAGLGSIDVEWID
jgi:hypothetical protein